jgi:hypothetical protein
MEIDFNRKPKFGDRYPLGFFLDPENIRMVAERDLFAGPSSHCLAMDWDIEIRL